MRSLAPVLVALALLAPLAAAQANDTNLTPPAEPSPIPRVTVGPVVVHYNLSEARPVAGEDVSFLLDVLVTGNATYDVAVYRPVPNGTVAKAQAPLAQARNLTNASAPERLVVPVPTPDAPDERHTFELAILVTEVGGNASWFETLSYTTAVVAPPTPTDGVFPVWAWALVALLVVAGGALLLRPRRKRQVRAPPRSRALQELQVEERAARARPKHAAEIEAERRAVEQREAERLAQREDRILEAKKQDLLRGIELARQRHERGEISAFQFQKLKEKKEAQLAELERQGGGA